VAVATFGGAGAAAAADHASLVNPLVGTGGDAGHTFPGAVVPFGMVQFSPVSARTTNPGGYAYGDTTVRGFALTRLSGAGCPNLGGVPIMPLRQAFGQYPFPAARFSHRQERASPGRYRVRLSTGIDVDLTATQRTAFATFRFPTRTAYLAFDVGGGATDQSSVRVERLGPSTIQGAVTDDGFCGGPASPTTHFVARFGQPFAAFSSWGEDGVVQPAVTREAVNTGGALLRFRLPPDRTLRVAVGISYVGTGNAARNLRAESSWNGEALARRARASWNAVLGRARVEGGTPAQRRTFATALYHSLIHPSLASDVNGQYRGRDGTVRTARGYRRYTHISGWDTYRTQMPLLALLVPQVASDVAQSIVAGAAEAGAAKWELGGTETGIMVGDPAPLLVATADAFGARRFDRARAFPALRPDEPDGGPFVYPSHAQPLAGGRFGAYVRRPGYGDYLTRGFVPFDHAVGFIRGPASTTLEYALADFALSRLAEATGHRRDAQPYRSGSRTWRQLFNPATRYLEPRLADGSFIPGFSPTSEDGFVEGNAAQYTWFVPHDVAGLVRLLGWERAARARLDRFHRRLDSSHLAPYAWLGNEPSFGTPWLYNWLGAPWRTQAVVRRAVNTLFRPLPAGLPGDDDLGALSSWYVWSALGLYPAVPAVGGLAVASPLFPAVELRTGLGRLRLEAPGAGTGAPYVHGLRLDGRPLERTWLPLSSLRGARTLRFDLRSSPSTRWAVRSRPPSFPRG
jgi:predicted alpha-1,2-mannosidase